MLGQASLPALAGSSRSSSALADNLRPKRSRKDRPCDHCRRLKHTCRIVVRGEPCDACRRGKRECTFHAPPTKRRRSLSPTPNLVRGSRAAPTSTMNPLLEFMDALEKEEEEVSEGSGGDEVYYPSLDMELNDEEESHYLGSGALAHLTLANPLHTAASTDLSLSPTASLPIAPGERLSYRQVSDPAHPVYFLRNPSKVYGLANVAFAAGDAYKAAIQLVRREGEDYPIKLVQMFLDTALPAMPILNRVRLEAACLAWQGAGAFPHTVLVGILAFMAPSMPQLRRKCKELWGVVVQLLDNEYRQPRLQTLQLALLDIGGRPIANPGGNHTAICRAIGAAQVLGLHRDSSKWRLPRWERSVRKRIWWTLYVHDKWNAFVYGRPTNLHSSTCDVPLPTLRDDDWEGENPPDHSDMASFVALCRMTVVLDSLLPLLATTADSTTQLSRRATVRAAAFELEQVYNGLPVRLRLGPSGIRHGKACAGDSSLQLGHFGLSVLICQLAIDHTSGSSDFSSRQLVDAAEKTLGIVEALIAWLDGLDEVDFEGYWAPWSSHQLTHTVSFLLRLALRLHSVSTHPSAQPSAQAQVPQTLVSSDFIPLPAAPPTLLKLFDVLSRLIQSIQRTESQSWEIADPAINRIKTLITSLPDLPGSGAVKELFATPAPLEAPDGAGDSEAMGVGMRLDVQGWLNSFDWFTGDLGSGTALAGEEDGAGADWLRELLGPAEDAGR